MPLINQSLPEYLVTLTKVETLIAAEKKVLP